MDDLHDSYLRTCKNCKHWTCKDSKQLWGECDLATVKLIHRGGRAYFSTVARQNFDSCNRFDSRCDMRGEMIKFSRTTIYELIAPMCRPVLVTLRGDKKVVNEFENFLDGDKYGAWDGNIVKKLVRDPKNSPLRLSVNYFRDHGAVLFNCYLNAHYNGVILDAMRDKKSFNELFNDFTDYFMRRRELFMEKTDQLIAQAKEQGVAQKKSGKMPSSHGGVANLLKVLTKTMQDQGSSIRTIAKVQYAVCTQAGIYIPDEFITDVLVAVDIENNPIV